MARQSLHIEPRGPLQIARHYVRELIYGANDGIITTFAVVAGVAGGDLSLRVVLIVGAANLFADGLSMAVGNFSSIRANEGARAMNNLPEEEAKPWRHAGATFFAFVAAGLVPLVPYALPPSDGATFRWSVLATLVSLFTVGALRATVTIERWWIAGLEMLSLGAAVAAAAYAAGAMIAALVS